MTIAGRLSQLLKERGIMQKAIAEVCDLTPAAVSAWIKGDVDSIPSSYLAPICKFLDCSPAYLLGMEEDEGSSVKLTESEERLLGIFRKLDWEGQQVVIANAISESRRMSAKGNNGLGSSTSSVG
ncbi:helix-turn-helix domain-containing protein [Faecousia sp.]|uniref:helix-turn-helix domain-containing protein n=1 Tax=Faecousia sp. TaxID=2952921 RepID=UPI003AB8DAC2